LPISRPKRRRPRTLRAAACLLVIGASCAANAQTTTTVPTQPVENFPRFSAPGHDREMAALNAMQRLHYPPIWLGYPHGDPDAGLCTLWDEWLTGPCLWPADESFKVCDNKVSVRQRLRNSFLNKTIDAEGYVSTHQHEGIGHALGWPFPYWMGNPGAGGAHFSAKDTKSPVLPNGVPVAPKAEGWTLTGVADEGMNENGWNVRLTSANASLITSPGFVDPFQSPFIQIRWSAKGLADARPYLEWETEEQPGFTPDRRMYFPPAGEKTVYEMIPLYRHPLWKGKVTRQRLSFANPAPGATVTIEAMFTQYDTRHNINNFDFIRGCIDFFLWTGDVDFLRRSLPRMRQAMHYAQSEFKTRENNCVLTTWVGHEGRTGVVRTPDGGKRIAHGNGIGNNYWDLLPFGHKDCYATVRYHHTLLRLAMIEREIARHPEWNVPAGADAFDPADLEKHAADVKAEGNRIFWSDETGRFVAGPDIDGKTHDYGFTFLNTDAIYYGFATDDHARQIMDWLEGKRTVAGDTSTGADIYHFRFAPRCTTRRNTDYYFWGWSNPESIPFGSQVQDGGCVLGWSYMDLMSRLKVDGPDNAWARLKEIAAWFEETQAAGGYREYYRKQGQVLQGDGSAGGLGLDREFVESLLVPQILLRGFLGLSPTADGVSLDPKLPSDFPSLTIDRIHVQGVVLTITATKDSLLVRREGGASDRPFTITAPGFKPIAPVDWSKTTEVRLAR
jgi:hypothetical protein